MNEQVKHAQQVCFGLLKEIKNICASNNLSFWLDGGTLLGAVRHKGFIPWDDDIDICFLASDYLKLIDILKNQKKEDRTLYYAEHDFVSWCDYYSDIGHIGNYLLPLKVDLLPVKSLRNISDVLIEDKSLFEIACIFVKGSGRNPELILPEHQHFLTSKNNPFTKKKDFFAFYFDWILEEEKKAALADDVVYNYIFNDVYASKPRQHYLHKTVFPLSKIMFEETMFPAPNCVEVYLPHLYGANFMQLPPIENRQPVLSKVEVNPMKTKQMHFLLKELFAYKYKNFAFETNNKRLNIIKKAGNICRFSLKMVLHNKWSLMVRFFRYNWFYISNKDVH